jgi:hypothetical protein
MIIQEFNKNAKNISEHSSKIKILIGIDEPYTKNKIIDCFKYRNEYEVYVYNREDTKQQKVKGRFVIYYNSMKKILDIIFYRLR